MEDKPSYSYRSFFWPVVLIGFGAIMLLANLDLIPTPSLSALVRLWPLALIILGLDILVGRRAPLIGALIGIGAVALIALVLYLAPQLDIVPKIERKTIPINSPLEDTTSAEVTLDLERYATTIDAAVDSDDLFDAVLETYTDVDFTTRGVARKVVNLKPVNQNDFDLGWSASTSGMEWKIGLSPLIPLDLSVDVGSGSATLDLFDLQLENLKVNGGSGSTDLAIPAGSERYPVDVKGGSGSFDIQIEEDAALEAAFDIGSGSFDVIVGDGVAMTLEIDGGSGSIFLQLAEDAGVRLLVENRGSGGVRVPGDFELVDDMGDDDSDTGVWESDNYDSASSRIELRFEPGSGTLTLRY